MGHVRRTQRRWRWAGGVAVVVLVAMPLVYFGAVYVVLVPRTAAAQPCRPPVGYDCVAVDGFDLALRQTGPEGDGVPVVALHGGPGMSSVTFRDGLAFVAAADALVMYDQRGSGWSEVQADIDLYTVDQLVEELETLRGEVLQVEQMNLIGHSFGGLVAQRYALAYPERVARMVLVSSLSTLEGQPLPAPVLETLLMGGAYPLAGGYPPRDPLAADVWFRTLTWETSVPHTDFAQPADLGYVSFAPYWAINRSAWTATPAAAVAGLEVETLIVYGALDGDTTGRAAMTRLATTLPNATAVELAASGHWPFLSEPDRFAAIVGPFLTP